MSLEIRTCQTHLSKIFLLQLITSLLFFFKSNLCNLAFSNIAHLSFNSPHFQCSIAFVAGGYHSGQHRRGSHLVTGQQDNTSWHARAGENMWELQFTEHLVSARHLALPHIRSIIILGHGFHPLLQMKKSNTKCK